METKELYALTEQNIRQAIEDYRRHTDMTSVLDDVSDDFIHKLAKDSVDAKTELRELFCKSPVWDEKLQALVINGTRTHDPDYEHIDNLARQILHDKIYGTDDRHQRRLILNALRFFTDPYDDQDYSIDALNELAPRAYAPNKKKSRVFKALCKALGVVDDTAGSDFQRLYAQIADEMMSKKINFKLYISINPAHFITMSNPKSDERGDTLTSCHSFNSTQYEYNNGCTGYARDNVTMIAFTASDPSNPETLNNRKTTRQLFMYKVGNGLLLQSRMYNSSGGTRGEQADSKLYRDLIQREISALEDAPNLWSTKKYHDSDITIHTGYGFGGYPDWDYSEFAPKISIRSDHKDNFKTFVVGTYGLCILCGEEINKWLYCGHCEHDSYCECCQESYNEEDLYAVHDAHGHIIQVCENCRDYNYSFCPHCEEWYSNDCVTRVAGDDYVCSNCLSEYYTQCENCEEWVRDEETCAAVDENGNEYTICDDCRQRYHKYCDECDRYVHTDFVIEATNANGNTIIICPSCREDNYVECENCGELFHIDLIEDGLCPECRAHKEEEDEAV